MPASPAGTGDGEHLPARVRATLPGISSRAWEHPADRAALTALRRIPGFDTVLRAVAGVFSERRLRLMHLAAAVRVGDQQFRSLHRVKQDCVRILDLHEEPELYVVQDPLINAYSLGLDHPFVVVTSGLVDTLDAEELRAVVGHELGHVLSGHALYSSVLFALLRMTGVSSRIPFGAAGVRAILLGLQEWHRKAEVSCDRAGLLASQDPGAATRVHMKTAGGSRTGEMSLVAFIEQAEEYQSAGDVRDGVLRMLNLLGASHPFSVLRVLELKRWVESGEYERILAGDYPRRSGEPEAPFLEDVRAAAQSYRDTAAGSADPFMQLLRDLGEGAGSAGGWMAAKVRGAARPGDASG